MSVMKAAVLRKINKPLTIENLILPKLTKGQLLVELKFSGVCHSQLMEIKGLRGKDIWIPHLLGHEGSGIVKKVANGVNKVKEGDKVVISWINTKGKASSTPTFKSETYNDIVNSGHSTTFSNFSIVSENKVFKIPRNISLKEAVLFGCAIPTGAGMVLKETKPLLDNKILVLGLGGIGLSILMTLIVFKHKDISVADINVDKIKLASKLGIKKTFNLNNKNDKKKLESIRNYDLIYEAAGKTKTIEFGFSLISDKGTLIFASHPEKGKRICIDPHDLIRGKKIIGSWGGGMDPSEVIKKFSKLKKSNNIDFSPFLNNIYSLRNINKAIKDLNDKKVVRPIIRF